MMYHFEDATCDEAHDKAFELNEFRMFVAREAVSGSVVEFRGTPAILVTPDDGTDPPEGFVEVDVCPYF